MLKNLLIAAGGGLALLAALLHWGADAAPLIVAASIALTFGWHIFSTLEVKSDKKRADTVNDIDDLVVNPLRNELSELTDSKNKFNFILKTAPREEIIRQIEEAEMKISQQFVSLAGHCKFIDSMKRPEFGAGWPGLAADAEDLVFQGFEMMLSAGSGGGPAFDEGADLVRRGLENLRTAAEQKIRALRKRAG